MAVAVPIPSTLVKETQNRGAWIRLNLHPSFGTFVFYEKKVHLTSLDSKWVTATPVAAATPRAELGRKSMASQAAEA